LTNQLQKLKTIAFDIEVWHTSNNTHISSYSGRGAEKFNRKKREKVARKGEKAREISKDCFETLRVFCF
jgi:hypothetical protein